VATDILEISLWALVDAAAASRPTDVILADDYGRTLTAVELREEAQRAAAALWERGIRPGDVVSWQLPTTLEAAVVMLACSRLAVVQNPVIPVLREREVALITQEAATRLIIVPEVWRGFGHGDMARALPVPVLALDLESAPATGMRLPAGDVAMLPPPPGPSRQPSQSTRCRWIYYSSGTTAEPKGARHTDASVIPSSNGMVEHLKMGVADVYPIAWPFAHIGGVAMLVAVLRAGGRLVLFDAFDPRSTPERMAAHRPTILGSATPFFQAYCNAQRLHGEQSLFPAVRFCVAGGAPTPKEVSHEVAVVLKVPGIAGSWGLTEFPVATSESWGDAEWGLTVGHPTRGVQIRVVDGELRVKGPQRMLGYVNPALDIDAFDEDGWFRTGDRGVIDDDGRVRILGRLKDVIIRNAENVSALEVENTVISHSAVADVAVIGVPDARTGERVCAVVVPEAGQEVTLAALAEHCRAAGLARYKTPELLRLVDVLPRNPMGKILKSELLADASRSAEPLDK
jgi:cyclohexanecarboxylate-CoA ligase